MTYVNDASQVVFLLISLVLLAGIVKLFFLDPRKKKQGQ